MFLAGVIGTVCLTWLIFYGTFLSDNEETWVGWVVLAVSALVGLLVGALLVFFVKAGAFVLAAWGGFSLGLLLYNSFFYLWMSTAGFWCFCIAIALVCGVLAIFFFDHIVINSTALAGAYLFVWGIGVVGGHYQNPFTIAEERYNGELVTIDPDFYAYLAFTVVMFILGDLVQYRQRKHGHHKHPYHDLK